MSVTSRSPITTIVSHYVVLPNADIDTDRIIPARFLKTTDRSGLGPHAFHDWRYRADGSANPDFPLNAPEVDGAEILVAGRNFACGSSREHAVWALQGAGIRAVVSTAFADIFRVNALGNGLLPVEVDERVHAALVADRSGSPITIDLETLTLTLADGTAVPFAIPAFSRHCLLRGIDELGYLVDAIPTIDAFESRRAPVSIR